MKLILKCSNIVSSSETQRRYPGSLSGNGSPEANGCGGRQHQYYRPPGLNETYLLLEQRWNSPSRGQGQVQVGLGNLV